MTQVNTLNKVQFEQQVENAKGLQVVDFYAEWCAPCRMISPLIDQLKQELGDRATVVKVDADSDPEILTKYAVRGMPTIMIFKDGQPEEVMVGAMAYQSLKNAVDKHLD